MGLAEIGSDFFDFIFAVKTKLAAHPYIDKPSNVIIGETPDLAELGQSFFPRFEILPLRDDGDGYESQRDLRHLYKLGVVGYIKRDSFELKERNVKDIVAMGETARSMVYGFLDDKQEGNPPCARFDFLNGYPTLDFDFELFDNIAVTLLGFWGRAQTKDTQI
jgi:hypothetical protein